MEISSLESLRQALPDFAKDVRLNLGMVLSAEGSPGLTESQVFGIALACAYATKDASVVTALEASAKEKLSESERSAAQAAATIMAMNNLYYRTMHLLKDDELGRMPAKLRMNVIGNPGVSKLDFELYSLAVSTINACEMCIQSHARNLRESGLELSAIQSTVRIASVIVSAAQAASICDLTTSAA